MSKICIITFTYGCNYGQRLQNYAVQSILLQRGHDVYTLFQKEPVIKKMHNEIRAIKNKVFNSYQLRKLNFWKFNRNYINEYHKKVSLKQNLTCLNDEFDYFVAGSDQIWSPISDDVSDIMFLTFAERTKRVAFAPSIGIDILPETEKERYLKYFLGFDNISVRENSAARIIYDITKQTADVLIDPTLMIDANEWKNLEVKPRVNLPPNYLLYYHLGSNEFKGEVLKLADDLNSEIIDLLSDRRLFSVGPSEFIWLVHHAKGVVTDSFHGTIFSMIFHVPFWVCKRMGSNIDMSCRFATLFNMFPDMKYYIDDYQKETFYDFDSFEKLRVIEQDKVDIFLSKVLS